MSHEEIATLMALLRLPGAGNGAARRALAFAGSQGVSLAELAGQPSRELLERFPVAATAPLATHLARCTAPKREKEHRLLDRIVQSGAQAIGIADSDYPLGLSKALGPQAPVLIFLAGDRELLDVPAAAVVGARDVSERGGMLAAECAATFARAGICVVSGGATGADSAAHGAALAAGGKTVVVSPQGLLTFRGSRELLHAMDEGRAMVVSEFLPDMSWQTHAAVTRNATISALSNVVCVVEPKKQGGSIRTARLAFEQGKRVLVYCAPSHREIADTLTRAGALSLLNEDGQFDAAYLLAQWESAPTPSGGQGELF